MSYRVFARKYRPQTFEEVVGQDHITRTLQNAVAANRLAQAYLFVGPRGIGKTSTARILAKALNCVNGPTISPCGVCDACREIADGRSLDVIEIDGASNNGVENIRELRDNAAYAPARGPYKIYLIDEVHMLSTGAFNALLKTLEEPPAHVKFIFATTEAQKVPATITSRCQRFDLRRIPAALIARHLGVIAEKEGIDLEASAADSIARGAEGGLRDAESMLDQMVAFCGNRITQTDVMDVFGFTALETVTSLADALFARDAAAALALVAEQSEAGKDLSRLTADLIGLLRDQLIARATRGDGPTPEAKLLDLIDHFSETESRMKWIADKKLQLDVAVIKALHLLDETSLTDVIETLSALREGRPLPDAPPPPAPPKKSSPPHAPPAAEKPLPAPAAEKPPSTRPPEPPAPSEPAASEAWSRIAEQLAHDSFIRFGWLREGVFSDFAGGVMRVTFPESSREHAEGIFMEEGRRDLEKKLLQAIGSPVKLAFQFDASLASAPDPEPPAPEPSPEPAAAEPPPAPAADPMEEFKNDPLIKNALEVFKSSRQTAAS